MSDGPRSHVIHKTFQSKRAACIAARASYARSRNDSRSGISIVVLRFGVMKKRAATLVKLSALNGFQITVLFNPKSVKKFFFVSRAV